LDLEVARPSQVQQATMNDIETKLFQAS